MFRNRKVLTFFLYIFYLLFGSGILGQIQKDMTEFSYNILKICKDHRRLKQEQQKLIITWIDEIFESKSVAFNLRYNLKKCKKSVSNMLDGKATMKDKIVKFFFERRLKNYQEQCRKLATASDPLSFKKEELEELRKFTEETSSEPNSGLRLNDFYSSKFENEADSILGNSFNLGESFKSVLAAAQNQTSQSDEESEIVKYILPYSSYDEYLDENEIPLIEETEKFILKHDSLLLLVPKVLPMHMNYVKMPLPQIEPQPREIRIDYSTNAPESQIVAIDELYKEGSEASIKSRDSVIEDEIVDEKLDIFDSSESSSGMLSESEFIDIESINIKDSIIGGKYKEKKRFKSVSVLNEPNSTNNEHISFNDKGQEAGKSESTNRAQSDKDEEVESSVGSNLSETDEETSRYENSKSEESGSSGTDRYYETEDSTDNSQNTDDLQDQSTSESQDDSSEQSESSGEHF
ncbi:unnamed protein product [Cryptosporidium hominis]|uniref:Uncharacterized protein n=2 Tax=Cryptosporidium hominis TaxID=237895 RepID=A0A0S4TCI2_CRYHO|nr:hypothetical protein [Cryptosporidium hominis TU502]CUV04749.1 unnamed protein product [Cryptosporidium hominis]